jgi:hypothetical protein
MTNWPHAGWSDFLSDRLLLYEIDCLCHRYAGAGTPTQYLGLNRIFSDSVCAEVDKGIAQFGLWVEGRIQHRKKVGKHKWEAAHKTLGEALGIVEEARRGGWHSGAELRDVSLDYRNAVFEAKKKGLPPPDIADWLAAQAAPQEDAAL